MSKKQKITLQHTWSGFLLLSTVLLLFSSGIFLVREFVPQAMGSELSQKATSSSLFASSPISEQPYCLDVPVILYHHVMPLYDAEENGYAQLTVDSVIFEQQMKYLKDSGYHSISLDELVDALLSKTQLPEKSIAVTLDDGYLDNYTYAFQILRKYQIKGNFMIPTGLIMNPDYMSWSHLREIRSSNLGYLYNHTWSHAALGYLTKQQIDSELRISQKQFQEKLGFTPTVFTYPYGSFSPAAIASLRSQGFKAGFTTTHGRVQCDTSIMTLYREHVGNAPLSAYGL